MHFWDLAVLPIAGQGAKADARRDVVPYMTQLNLSARHIIVFSNWRASVDLEGGEEILLAHLAALIQYALMKAVLTSQSAEVDDRLSRRAGEIRSW